jgi:hypothetical protein
MHYDRAIVYFNMCRIVYTTMPIPNPPSSKGEGEKKTNAQLPMLVVNSKFP